MSPSASPASCETPPETSARRAADPLRPRERLARLGPDALSDSELLAILLRTGTGGLPVLDLARRLLAHFGGLRGLLQLHRRRRRLQDKVWCIGMLVFGYVDLHFAYRLRLIPPDSMQDNFPRAHRDIGEQVIPIRIRLCRQRNPLHCQHHFGEIPCVHPNDAPGNRAGGQHDGPNISCPLLMNCRSNNN